MRWFCVTIRGRTVGGGRFSHAAPDADAELVLYGGAMLTTSQVSGFVPVVSRLSSRQRQPVISPVPALQILERKW